MNNVRRTLVKSYGILFPVVEASRVKHFCSPAAGKKSNKRSLLFKHDRRCLCTCAILLRATHMFKCVFKTKPTISYPPPRNRRRGNGKGKVFFFFKLLLLLGMRSVAVATTVASQPEDPGVKSPSGPWGFYICSCPSSVGVVLSWLLTSAVKAGACRLWPSFSSLV